MPPLAGVEAAIFQDFLIVLAAGELRPGAFLADDIIADIYGVGLAPVRRVFDKMARLGLVSASPVAGVQVETIAPGGVPEIIDRARTLSLHIVGQLAESGLDRIGRARLRRHSTQQALAEAGGDWPRTNILGMEFLALLPRAARDKERLPNFDGHAMRLMLLRARYDLFGEPLPSASMQRLLLMLIEQRRADEAVRLVERIYDGIIGHLRLDRGAESVDLRKALARVDLTRVESERPRPRLVAVDGRRLGE